MLHSLLVIANNGERFFDASYRFVIVCPNREYRQHQHDQLVILGHAHQTAALPEQFYFVTARQFVVRECAGDMRVDE